MQKLFFTPINTSPQVSAPIEESDQVSIPQVTAPKVSDSHQKIRLPFPNRMIQLKPIIELDNKLLDTFRKVEVNIPLLDTIKQIPKYAKFLKDLCMHKRRLKGNEKVSVGQNVSVLI